MPLLRTVGLALPADGSLEVRLMELDHAAEAAAGAGAAAADGAKVAARPAVREMPEGAASLQLTVQVRSFPAGSWWRALSLDPLATLRAPRRRCAPSPSAGLAGHPLLARARSPLLVISHSQRLPRLAPHSLPHCPGQVALDGTLDLACSAVFADEAAAPKLLASVSAAAQPAGVELS